MSQTLWDVAHNGSETSREAAQSIRGCAGKLAAQVLAEIVRLNGATCDEIEVSLSMKHQTASARMRELALAKQIVESGEKRLTRSNRNAVVWVKA